MGRNNPARSRHQRGFLFLQALVLSGALSLLALRAVPAAVFNIPNGDVAALKAALAAANSNGQADTINLAAGGTYTLTVIDNTTNGSNGLPVIVNDATGLDLTINGNGAIITRSTAAGTPEFRILHIASGAAVSCTSLTVANGKSSGAFPASVGGGIFNFFATLNLTGCAFRENTGLFGGGLYNNGGSLDIRTTTFEGNHAVGPNNNGSGGGIFSLNGTVALLSSTLNANTSDGNAAGLYSSGTVTITGSAVTQNISAGASGGLEIAGGLTMVDSRVNDNATEGAGGGITVTGSATLQRCTVNGNSATGNSGGGIFNTGTLTVESSSFNGNKCKDGGGAIGGFGATSKTSAQNGTFSNNQAGYGGGLSNRLGTLKLTNCTVSGNAAATFGGGLHNDGGSSVVRSATFCANNGANGGGIVNVGNGQVTLGNTILRNGLTGANVVNLSGTFTSYGCNLSNDTAGGDTSTAPGGLLNAFGDIRNTEPNLGSLQNNGGLTLTHAPVAPSPAIDAGDDSILDPPLGLATDQRGPGFPRRIGVRVDIGAVEVGLDLTVTTTDDHDDGVCSATDCTLREALNASNAAGGGNISFTAGVRGTIQLAGALPDVSANLRLQGPGRDALTVRRVGGGDYRIFTVRNNTANGLSAIIVGLTIRDGRAPFLAFPNNCGGGILNVRGCVSVVACALLGNSSDLTSSEASYGGGICNYEGSLYLEDSTLAGNQASNGGGIASLRSANAGLNEMFLRGCTLSGNTCPNGGAGGGIYQLANGANAFVYLSALNCTLSGNSAGSSFFGTSGGALFTGGASSGSAEASFVACTLAGNSANAGGAIYNSSFGGGALVTLRNTILKTGALGNNLLNSSGVINSEGHNLCSDDAAGPAGTVPGGYLNGGGDIRNTDPLLGPLGDNGGPTQTHALLPGSPAINAGEDEGGSATDQRGFLRVGTDDIGAFEFTGLQLRVVNVARAMDDVVVAFTGQAGRLFRLERKLTLGSDTQWQPVPGVTDLKPTSDGIAQFTDPGALVLGKAFYRVELVVP